MKCPHCLNSIYTEFTRTHLGHDTGRALVAETYNCPSCKKIVVQLGWVSNSQVAFQLSSLTDERLAYPECSSRSPCPPEVPSAIAEDYKEACIVLSDSPKASAALSRRCLQNLLREKAGITSGNLVNEIQQVIDQGNFTSHLAESIDAIRNIVTSQLNNKLAEIVKPPMK